MKKIFGMAALLQMAFLFIFTFQSHSQGLSSTDIQAQMVKDWERAKAYTVDYLNTMPANKYSFKAVDSLRSFAMQMLHLAGANVLLMSAATGGKGLPGVGQDLEHRTSAQTKDSVMYFVTASYDYCINAVKTYDVNKWGEKTKVFGRFEETRFAVMNKAFEHQGHHRGQTTIYIRLQGIKPPQERLF